MNLREQYEAETGERAMYRKDGADYHTLRYVRWLEARYVALVELLRDDGLVRAVARNSEWSGDIRYNRHGAIYDYRARLLAKIEDKETP